MIARASSVAAHLALTLALTSTAAPAGAARPGPPPPPPLRVAPPDGGVPGGSGSGGTPRCQPWPAESTVESAAAQRLRAAHALATGRGQVIAVIDTGVAPHPRLGARLTGGGDYLGGGDGLEDCDGHGTAVAGLLAAAPGPDDEFVGVAPDVEVLSIRQSRPADGSAPAAGDTDTLAAATVRAVRLGATVVNISAAVCLPADRAASAGASLQAALRFAARSDVVVVAAAGNDRVGGCTAADAVGDQVALPGWYDDDVLTVGAAGPAGAAADFTVPGPWVDLVAPGTALRSLAVGGGLTGSHVVGTSFAAPWVAGLAALVRERFPDLSAAEVVDRLLATAGPVRGGAAAVGHGGADPVAALTAEPLLLAPDDAAPDRAVLAGTGPAPPRPEPVHWPLLAPVLAFLVATLGAVAVLRARPRGPRRGHPGRAAEEAGGDTLESAEPGPRAVPGGSERIAWSSRR